ncbi:MAG: adenosine deaminase [Treponema sp.]|jgi:adenosine deaminase|nr:adenosine deaminase [Treponema sp.]
MTDQEWVENLPKVDLHYHFDGSMRLETALELLQAMGEKVTLESLTEEIQIHGPCPSLAVFLGKFERTFQCEQTAANIERIAFEHVEDAAKHKVMYFEVRFAPQLMRREGLSVMQTIDSVLQGLRRGMERYDEVIGKAIVCGMRGDSLQDNMDVVDAALARKNDGVVAIDIAGDEVGYPPLLLMDMFDRAREGGLPFTIHAGEAGDPQNIKEAAMLGAQRIGHGTHIRYDENLIRFYAKRGIAIEMCPTSNVQTHAVNSFDDYPIREYFDKGLNITVNTDDATVSNTTLSQELLIAMDRFHFTRNEVLQLTRNAIGACFSNDEVKKHLHRKLDQFAGA